MAGFSVAGRQFRTQEDYHAALRDQEKIDEIRAKVNICFLHYFKFSSQTVLC